MLTRSVSDDGRPLYSLDKKETYVIPGDIHFPIHNPRLVNLLHSDEFSSGSILLLQGDTFDQEAFNRFPKDPERLLKTDSIKLERKFLDKYLNIWLGKYKHVIFGPGNHENRAGKMSETNPAFSGMGWWWPYGSSLMDSRVTLLDYGYRARIGRVVVEHGDQLRGAGSKSGPAHTVASNARDGLIHVFGHTHRVCFSEHISYSGGKRLVTAAINIGTLVDSKKQTYASEPDWSSCIVSVGPTNIEWRTNL